MKETIHQLTPAEFFKEKVDLQLRKQRVVADDLTTYYLVNLLCRFVRLGYEGQPHDPLAVQLAQALSTHSWESRSRFRALGDFALFVTGFFADSLNRRAVDVDYYVEMGRYAYGSLGNHPHRNDDFNGVFQELAGKFVQFADVLAGVSDQTTVRSNSDVLRRYEKWLRTRSKRDRMLLEEQGIFVNASVKLTIQ